MKKFIFTALLPLLYFLYSLFLIPSLPAQATAASGSYACVLFLLPESYFVKVLSVDGDYCRIEYLYDDTYTKKLTGYAKTADLTFVDYTPSTPYLYHLFEVRYTIDDSFLENDDFLSQITVTCAYYGDYKIGSET